MIMTSSLLFLLARQSYSKAEFLKKNASVIEALEIWNSGNDFHARMAYLIESQYWKKDYAKLSGYIFVVTGSRPSLPTAKDGAAVLFLGDVSCIEAFQCLSEKWMRLLHFDALTEQTARTASGEAALTTLIHAYEKIYPCAFSLNDKYLNTLYLSDGFMDQLGESGAPTLTEDHVQVLLASHEFHHADTYEMPFYYTDTYTGKVFLCKNVFIDGIYVMRLVSFCEAVPDELRPGLEELLTQFARHLSSYLNHHPDAITIRHAKDSLHQLVRTCLYQNPVRQVSVSELLDRYCWKETDRFLLVKYTFSENVLPENYTKSSLPYLCQRLEGMYEFSCAILSADTIFHLIDLTASHMEENLGQLLKQISLLVREHICNAGISDPFYGLHYLPDARKQTEVALKLGKRLCPDRWCFHFRDYWKAYILEQLQKDFQPQMLCDPRLLQLIEYDHTNHTELAESLYVYLTCQFNGAIAADKLHVHRTTFFRRMERIHQLIPLHLEQEDDVFSLLLSYHLMKLC